jgi:hypothetical protein
LIGKQSVLWDLAGAIIEWDLNESQIEVLMNELQARKARINSRALEFYLLAYAAFRMGFTRLGWSQEGEDKVERNRLVRASKRYQKKLVALLNQPSS